MIIVKSGACCGHLTLLYIFYFRFIGVYFVCICFVLYYCERGGVDLMVLNRPSVCLSNASAHIFYITRKVDRSSFATRRIFGG